MKSKPKQATFDIEGYGPVLMNKAGSKWIALCPFHGEKTASFQVDERKGEFYCFGCQRSGKAERV